MGPRVSGGPLRFYPGEDGLARTGVYADGARQRTSI